MLIRQAMPRRGPKVPRIPATWLMTDARLGDAMPAIVAAMPARSAVVIRPYAMVSTDRVATMRAIRRVARAKRHLLLLAGGGAIEGYDGRHGHQPPGPDCRLRSCAVHSPRELAAAKRARAQVALISPIFATRSHPGVQTLGRRGFARMARAWGRFAIALGGVDGEAFRRLRFDGAHGWAGIDAWAKQVSTRQCQKRNCVPT